MLSNVANAEVGSYTEGLCSVLSLCSMIIIALRCTWPSLHYVRLGSCTLVGTDGRPPAHGLVQEQSESGCVRARERVDVSVCLSPAQLFSSVCSQASLSLVHLHHSRQHSRNLFDRPSMPNDRGWCVCVCVCVCVLCLLRGREKKEGCECLYACCRLVLSECEGHFSWSHALGF